MSGLVSCPGKLHQPRNLQFSTFEVLRDFLHRFIRRVFYPVGRNLRLSQTSGMVSTTTSVGRVWSSYTRRGRRLANSRPPAELRGSLDEGDRILGGFYVSRADDTLQLLIFRAPIQLNIYILENFDLQRIIRSQECENNSKSGTRSGIALNRGLQLACRDEQLLVLLGPPVGAARGGFGISLASHWWPLVQLRLLWVLSRPRLR